ncbi:hypothetical protein [Commensalibacter papalotli (ex Botero et al. 2024)]|uniref:HMA domain-containing protein n=1 Tax=Commensalibacter papalotli (ex Botero et al. 2024) TaxID=2972766 RepID=A0ABM9HQL2_9PROT|nr:hypothetical protein [Commensalibacter papalotli (ex Botero et al. 2024)]CAI3944789.1 unnamed protein product [Commensalibacter papalotli (ex Botero et al. 2024)]CAI3946078.1 unnamed protein product [Commensalibacter papalotli (ex Botero et al. 2024)]
MQSDLSHPLKTIEFFIESKNSKLNIENVNALIKNIEGVISVGVHPSSGQVTTALKDDSLFDKKFIEIQRALLIAGYTVKIKNTDGVQAVLFFGTMALGFLFVAVVITLWYYFGSLPSWV